MKTKTFLGLLIVLLTLTACGGAQDNIVGTWEDTDGYLFIFEEDGTLTLSGEGVEIDGSYEFIDKDTMELEFDTGGLGLSLMDVKIVGDTMTLTDEDDATYLLTRVEE
jgi:hypothetical protein